MKILLFAISSLSLIYLNCGLFEWETEEPTKSRMEGIWKVTEAYNENGDSILKKISFPVAAFQIQDKNSYLSTAEPMAAYIVYGGSKYAEIASKIDQVLDYSKLEVFDGYEWYIDTGSVNRFTIAFKIQGFPGVATIAEILDWLNIKSKITPRVIYHKFKNVKVTFTDSGDSTMVWEFDNQTQANYNCKDANGDDYLWEGVSTSSFARCKFVLKRQVKTLKELMTDKS